MRLLTTFVSALSLLGLDLTFLLSQNQRNLEKCPLNNKWSESPPPLQRCEYNHDWVYNMSQWTHCVDPPNMFQIDQKIQHLSSKEPSIVWNNPAMSIFGGMFRLKHGWLITFRFMEILSRRSIWYDFGHTKPFFF